MNKIDHRLRTTMVNMSFWLGMFAAGAVAAQSPMVTSHGAFEGMENQEGDLVTFEVVRGPENIDQTLNVNVRVTESGDMLQASDKGSHTLHFEPWHDLAYIDLDTIDDSVNEGPSRVTFSILGGVRIQYRVAEECFGDRQR